MLSTMMFLPPSPMIEDLKSFIFIDIRTPVQLGGQLLVKACGTPKSHPLNTALFF